MRYTTDDPLFNDIVNRVEAYRQNGTHNKIDRRTGRPFYEGASNAGRAAADRDFLLEVIRQLQRQQRARVNSMVDVSLPPTDGHHPAGPRGYND